MLELPCSIEIMTNYSCNLTCKYCTNLSPYFRETGERSFVSLDKIEQTCRDWAPRLKARHAVLLGGEPLLHPDIEQMCAMLRKYWFNMEVLEVITNGLLLHKMPDSFFETLKKNDIYCHITLHSSTIERTIISGTDRLKKHGCNYGVFDYTNVGDHQKYYSVENGRIKLAESIPQKAYEACHRKYRCPSIHHNRLFHCGMLGCARRAYELGVIKDHRMLYYTPASPDMTDKQLEQWWTSDFSAVCGICPEHFDIVQPAERFLRQ